MRLIEESEVYARICKLADETAIAVHAWPLIAQKTVGSQLIAALDSIGANLVEGDGRGPSPDGTRFWRYARGSAREARHWFHRAKSRGYIGAETCDSAILELTEVVLMLQGLIRHRESKRSTVREVMSAYDLQGSNQRFDENWPSEHTELEDSTEFPDSLISLFPSPETK